MKVLVSGDASGVCVREHLFGLEHVFGAHEEHDTTVDGFLSAPNESWSIIVNFELPYGVSSAFATKEAMTSPKALRLLPPGPP